MRFHDRAEAGALLAKTLLRFKKDNPLILALPRGGVPVAFEIARLLDAPMDILVVRKLGVPGHEELAFGAIDEEGTPWLNAEVVSAMGVSDSEISKVVSKESSEIDRRINTYRGASRSIDVKGRTVILVDDGLATGATAIAAATLLKKRHALKIILAVPVASSVATERLKSYVDEIVCPMTEDRFSSVAEWYDEFYDVNDKTVARLLTTSREFDYYP